MARKNEISASRLEKMALKTLESEGKTEWTDYDTYKVYQLQPEKRTWHSVWKVFQSNCDSEPFSIWHELGEIWV